MISKNNELETKFLLMKELAERERLQKEINFQDCDLRKLSFNLKRYSKFNDKEKGKKFYHFYNKRK